MAQSTKGNRNKGKPMEEGYQPFRAPRGFQIICQGWPQEAALRMLMNSLDTEIAEQPRELVACGTSGKVLRDWDCFGAAVRLLKGLKENETLLVESGKPAGVFETHKDAPRVLIANSNTSSSWKDIGEFGVPCLMPYGQATAASWSYVGAQEFLPTAFHVLDAVAQKHFSGDLAGKLIVSGGMGAAGGALSLASELHGAAFLGIDVDGERIKRRIRAGYCDYCVNTLEESLRILKNAVRQKQAVSVGLVGNCAEVIPELAGRGVVPDILTDQTSAHDFLNGYIPSGTTLDEAGSLRHQNPREYLDRVRSSIARHVEGMLAIRKLGAVVFEFGNNIRSAARECGVRDALAFPRFVEDFLRPLLLEGLAPIRWITLSGEAEDVRRFDDLALKFFPDDPLISRWIPLARKYVRFQGLPARVCWLGSDARIILACHVNRLVGEGVFKAPVVIALDHANCGSAPPTDVASSEIEDRNGYCNWTFLNALMNTASGASWVAVESGGGYWCSSSVALVADGTSGAAKQLTSVLKNDANLRVIRMADTDHTKTKTPMPRRPQDSLA